MIFLKSERVIYKQNPLIEVVCQLRFPPILKISHQEPVEFQDEIRSMYPLFETNELKLPTEILNFTKQAGIALPIETTYSFKSEDQKWCLSISKDFIAIATSSYERYEQFSGRFQDVIEIFERIYKPSFYTRLGLRYKDLIVRSKLGVEDKKWSELIAKHIASELYDLEFSSLIQGISKNLILKVEDLEGGFVNLSHGLVTTKNSINNLDETAYLFDADFYIEQKIEGQKNAWDILNRFNQCGGNLFRGSITDTLRNAMEPSSID